MIEIEGLLREKASKVRPSQHQLEGARRSHAFVREQLQSGQMDARIVRSYLSGSYERDTAVYPLDDVDIIFEIEAAHWKTPWLQSRPEPEAVLQTFARALRWRYQESKARLQRRSVGLVLSHLHIDVVPAIARDGGLIEIPDRSTGNWIVSGPSIHRALGTEANKACGGLFKPLVRLLKAWNNGGPSTANLKSFAVETIALLLARSKPFGSLAEGALRFFDFVAWLGGFQPMHGWKDRLGVFLGDWASRPNLPDVARTGHNVLASCTAERAANFARRSGVARRKLYDAGKARDPNRAARLVSELFS
jgi:hypothetical protein